MSEHNLWPGKQPAPPGISNGAAAELLRTPEVARRLGLSKRRVQMLLKAGLLPGARLGRTWLIPRQALDGYLRGVATQARKNLVRRKSLAQEAKPGEIERS
ncbi:MAG: excisionase family DNA-binding protein [Planctomycetes bacterium]|nr:excisionase family DNA-binding protein [Planctomycetota bacterium]